MSITIPFPESRVRSSVGTSDTIFLFAGYGRREAVEILLNAGANVHARDDGGLIPLHNACSFGHAEVVSLLLRAGADPNARDNWSYTPLHEGSNEGDALEYILCLGFCSFHQGEKRCLRDVAATRCRSNPAKYGREDGP